MDKKQGSRIEYTIEHTIEECDFSVSLFGFLKRAGLMTIEDIVVKSEEDIQKVTYRGDGGSFGELKSFLTDNGFHFGMEIELPNDIEKYRGNDIIYLKLTCDKWLLTYHNPTREYDRNRLERYRREALKIKHLLNLQTEIANHIIDDCSRHLDETNMQDNEQNKPTTR